MEENKEKFSNYFIRTTQAFGCLLVTSIVSLIFLNLVDIPAEDLIKLFTMPCLCIPFTIFFINREHPVSFKEKIFPVNIKNLLNSLPFIVIAVCSLLLISWITGLLSGQTGEMPYEEVNPFILVFAYCIFGPISEETLYRGLLCDTNNKLNTIFVAVLFAAVHFSLLDMPYLIVMSILNTYAYHKYESIYPSIIIHSVCNMIMLGIAYGVFPVF